jgi:hypothetical protein
MKKSGFVWFLCLLLSICSLSCFLPRTYSFAYVNSSHSRVHSQGRIQKIYIDKDFGNADAVAIQDALNQWSYALNGYIEFQTITVDLVHGSMEPLRESERGEAWLLMKIDSNNPLVVFHDKPEHPALAFCEAIGGHHLYLIRDRIPNENVRGVVMHEVGHLLGAEHRWGDGLMNPAYHESVSQCIDKDTLTQVAAYQHLPVENMNYCIYNDDKGQSETVTTVTVIQVD